MVGDLLHTIAQVSEPTWCAGVDTDKAQSAASREKLLAQAEEGGLDHSRPVTSHRVSRLDGWSGTVTSGGGSPCNHRQLPGNAAGSGLNGPAFPGITATVWVFRKGPSRPFLFFVAPRYARSGRRFRSA